MRSLRHLLAVVWLLLLAVQTPLVSSRLTGDHSNGDEHNDRKLLPAQAKIPGSYIVLFDDSVDNVSNKAAEVLASVGNNGNGNGNGPPFIEYVYENAVKGMNVRNLPPQAIEAIFQDAQVLSVEEDGEVHAIQVLPWGLDRIDEPNLDLDNSYECAISGTNNGVGVTIFIIDTGEYSTWLHNTTLVAV